jgi:2-hydroxychromene-2-carboxylate isomerase
VLRRRQVVRDEHRILSPVNVRFLFDYVSPYAYLAATRIRAIAARHGRDVEAVPVLFAAMLDATGGRGPAEIPAKRDYIHRDVVRIGRALGVPIEPPATHPFNPLIALRATGCVEDPAARWNLIEEIYRAAWARGLRVDQAQVVAQLASDVGLEGPALVERAASAEAKDRLRRTTDEAVAAGAFGVPTMFVDGEMFWGVDSLPHLERLLSGEAPIDAATVARWRAVVPSAQRRGGGGGA